MWSTSSRRRGNAGIHTIIDATTFDIGRDIRYREEISRKSGIQIVAATGQPLFAAESYNAPALEEITGFFIKEIERGIDDTDIKAECHQGSGPN